MIATVHVSETACLEQVQLALDNTAMFYNYKVRNADSEIDVTVPDDDDVVEQLKDVVSSMGYVKNPISDSSI
jgi:hypothetical protein